MYTHSVSFIGLCTLFSASYLANRLTDRQCRAKGVLFGGEKYTAYCRGVYITDSVCRKIGLCHFSSIGDNASCRAFNRSGLRLGLGYFSYLLCYLTWLYIWDYFGSKK